MKIETVGESLHWSYANLAMAHAAVSKGSSGYGRLHYVIRNRLYTGLRNGTMNVGSIVEDERLKMILPQACCYCASREWLEADHLIPRRRGGADRGDNLVWACRACNGSKNAEDVLVWLGRRARFPSLLLLRRYLKLALQIAQEQDVLSVPLNECGDLPFRLAAIPHKFPRPDALVMWITHLSLVEDRV